MKKFYGSVSLTARLKFSIEAESQEEAENIVFNDIEGLEMFVSEDSKLELAEIDWNLISNVRTGNVSQPNISSFEIQEES